MPHRNIYYTPALSFALGSADHDHEFHYAVFDDSKARYDDIMGTG